MPKPPHITTHLLSCRTRCGIRGNKQPLNTQPQTPQQVRGDKNPNGFTLIELSIVIVIIGLIVGGVLVGRDLIRASQLRGLISEVEEFKTAANTFRLKYGQLPGDMHINQTAQLGFFTFTGVNAGVSMGNSNGVIDAALLELFCSGEGSVFFYHLAQANLIKLSNQAALSTDTAALPGLPIAETSATPYTLSQYLPESKIGGAFFCSNRLRTSWFFSNIPAYAAVDKSVITLRGPSRASNVSKMEPSISPIELYSIDIKIDDGKPVQGNLLNTPSVAFIANSYWAATASSSVCTFGGTSATDITQAYNSNAATGGDSKTCQPVFIW